MTNHVEVAGIISSIDADYTYTNKKTGTSEMFYKVILMVPRLSENYDELFFNVPEKLLHSSKLETGQKVVMIGSMRTRNYTDKNNVRHVKIYGFVEDIYKLDDEEYDNIENKNYVRLLGTVCRQPVYRTTGSGRIIADVMVAVSRYCFRRAAGPEGTKIMRKSYYFPCLAWGPSAKAARKLMPGDSISITGRFQSRKYRRKADTPLDEHVAYEISILDYEVIEPVENGETIA